MGGRKMGIIERLFQKSVVGHGCEPCREKFLEMQKEHKEHRKRIKQMEAELTEAAMNGEERWFLVSTKKEDHQHGQLDEGPRSLGISLNTTRLTLRIGSLFLVVDQKKRCKFRFHVCDLYLFGGID